VSGQNFGFGVGVGVGAGVAVAACVATGAPVGEVAAVPPPPHEAATMAHTNRATVAFSVSFGVIGSVNRISARGPEPPARALV
jgi:hypothetical protein